MVKGDNSLECLPSSVICASYGYFNDPFQRLSSTQPLLEALELIYYIHFSLIVPDSKYEPYEKEAQLSRHLDHQ